MIISRMALWKIEQNYKEYGEDGLKDHKPGRLFEPLSAKFYDLVVYEWKIYKCGARKLHAILKKKGFKVSLRKISHVLIKQGKSHFLRGKNQENTKDMSGQSRIICGIRIGML